MGKSSNDAALQHLNSAQRLFWERADRGSGTIAGSVRQGK
ncbi:hypothetical protein HMPREF0322_00848 [Desulfitobacterium hafniense DP7]|uniref:Uncharacterized protein n=1 Tax=Desulfitobacterium hafniense DP7 TaxID=537010 RepID=G9XIS2_DESHA|nr:hypothetical protein HMPREF0322_00848 [Desulfitobacterium hafniense DP7]